MKVRCTRNDSTSLPYVVGEIYTIGYDHGGGSFEIYDGKGGLIIAPLNGHYLTFSPL